MELPWHFFFGVFYMDCIWCFEQELQRFRLLPKAGLRAHLYGIFVFVLVTLAWIPFNTPSVRSAERYLVGLLPPYTASFNMLILPDLMLVFFSLWLDWQEQRHKDLSFPRQWSLAAQSWSVAIAFILLFFFAGTGSDLSRFVYQFF